MEFRFGSYFDSEEYNSKEQITFEGRTLDECINRFKVEVLFPEKYIDYRFIENMMYEDEDGEEYYNDEEEWVIPPDAKIFIFKVDYDNSNSEDKHVAELVLADCINVDLTKFSKAIAALPLPEDYEEETEKLPVIEDKTKLAHASKPELRRMVTEIEKMKEQMVAKMEKLELAKEELMMEVARKSKIIYAYGTFLGEGEEIIQLLEGKDASEDEPLHLYQQTLYMDEEVGIWGTENVEGFEGVDFKEIETFDEWIKLFFKNYCTKFYK